MIKTKSSIRILPLPKIVLEYLKTLYNECKNTFGFNDDWFVFATMEPITKYGLDQVKAKYIKLSGVKYIRLHDFRHSCASLLINNGANITLVAKYLGHTKIEETLNTYAHLYKSKMDDIINLIDDLNNQTTKISSNITFYSSELKKEITLLDYIKEVLYKLFTSNKVLSNDLISSLLNQKIIQTKEEYINVINNFVATY